MDRYYFSKDDWDSEAFRYVSSPAYREIRSFQDGGGFLTNERAGGYDYISMISKKLYHTGAVLRTVCSFSEYGAPLIVLSNDIRETESGLCYGLHFEVVVYEEGCNVWRIVPADTPRKIAPTALTRQTFPLPAGKPIQLEVRVQTGMLKVRVNDIAFEAFSDEIPEQFYAGITGCEGINQFYEFSAGQEEQPAF